MLAAAACVGAGALVLEALPGSGGALRLAGGQSVVVQPGDTVWSIARSAGGSSDVRTVVDAIQLLNGLDGGRVVPGQVLHLP
ncbi:LysM peptidoglycan-binding domain-containing protein [Geodermatophilus sp. YIM 151500]|uniref:LysM peptidoglycan-binding domain-containing protein n=1 Tax=Geodermatophilus sp. YIM 151500 TaxID=2984531 RepID=UPI0021E4035F|nr:LysM peptidoglycan-binding domain-containing protein [Geodermatophilus sp. YIM 151500]MCV2488387.1 LysM peptidoglycan-binding domain-containing protein [Geodermatophilus sp. YIM 151500]